jgi:hypothetical protein
MKQNVNCSVSIILILLFVFIAGSTRAQDSAVADTSAIYKVTLTDGSELIGKISQQDAQAIVFVSNAGLIVTIQRPMVRSLEKLQGKWSEGAFIREDPNQTRLLFAPTGKTLRKGKGYFSAYELFFPFIAYGINDQITIAGGMTLFPGASSQILYFAPKVRMYQKDKFSLSTGVLYMNASEFGAGMLYGVGSYGTERSALTAGLGFGVVDGELSKRPMLVLGGEMRASNYVKFVTENWFPPDADGAVISFGIRFFGEHLAADFGLITFTKIALDAWPFFPWLGFVYNF